MRKSIWAAILTAGFLTACTGGAMQTGIDLAQDAGAGIVRNISAADMAALKTACSANAPVLDAVVASPIVPAPVSAVAVYPAAFCRQILTGATGNVNSNSIAWLSKVLSDAQTAAQIAGYVLPVVLPLL